MRVLQIFNRRRTWGGEDLSIADTVDALAARGHTVELFDHPPVAPHAPMHSKLSAVLSGVYSIRAGRDAGKRYLAFRPDVVHAHNLYPHLSPSVLRVASNLGIPTVWHPHDQRPICPTGLSLYRGATCNQCSGGHDYWCVLRNCRGSLLESTAYALRNHAHRMLRAYQRYSSLTLVWSEFLRSRLIRELAFSPDRVRTVPHPVAIPKRSATPSEGRYVCYVGRISPEKGICVLLDAARRLPHIPFRIAGGSPALLNGDASVPSNVHFEGWMSREALPALYLSAAVAVVPSVCFEVFPTSAIEALSYGLPVIGSNIGGIPEAVLHGQTGFLVEPGDAHALARQIDALWSAPDLRASMGSAGRILTHQRFSTDHYVGALLAAYEDARSLVRRRPRSST